MEEDFDDATMDACLIAGGQRAEHYEMAAYGTLVAWAKAMGHTEAAKFLRQTLAEEKATDKKLAGLLKAASIKRLPTQHTPKVTKTAVRQSRLGRPPPVPEEPGELREGESPPVA